MLSVFFLLNNIGIDFAVSIDFFTVSYVTNDEYFFKTSKKSLVNCC